MNVTMIQFAFFSRKFNNCVYVAISLLGKASSCWSIFSGLNLARISPMRTRIDAIDSPKFFNALKCCLIMSTQFPKAFGVSLVSLG